MLILKLRINESFILAGPNGQQIEIRRFQPKPGSRSANVFGIAAPLEWHIENIAKTSRGKMTASPSQRAAPEMQPRCPVHDIGDDFTCPAKPCKYVGKTQEEVWALANEANALIHRLQLAQWMQSLSRNPK